MCITLDNLGWYNSDTSYHRTNETGIVTRCHKFETIDPFKFMYTPFRDPSLGDNNKNNPTKIEK